MNETKLKYYDLEEIKNKFSQYGPREPYSISDNEYRLFTAALSCLPKNIVDKVNDEVQFVLLSYEDNSAQKNVNQACYIDLKRSIPEDKKAIIVLSPLIFRWQNKRGILHEIAHHILGSWDYSNFEDIAIKEREVEAKVNEWMKDRFGE